jgi:hypothetical protein
MTRFARRFRPALIALFVAWSAQSAVAAAQTSPSHDREFWRSIIKQRYAVPAGQSPFSLAQELSGLLASPDPELRDAFAYTILASWIGNTRVLADAELLSLLDEWQANLQSGLGETDTDSVLKRSFSALCLAELAERDLQASFVGPARYRTLLDGTLAYLVTERDLRGYDQTKGWVHATAHAADLLKALARNPLLTKDDQRRVLDNIAQRLASARQVFTQGEQDRLAQVAVAIALRQDFDAAAFEDWIVKLRDRMRQVWRASPLTAASLATTRNDTYFLQALYVRLSMETLVGPAATSRTTVLNALRPR